MAIVSTGKITVIRNFCIIFLSNALWAQDICIQWHQTNYPGSCAGVGIRSEGIPFVDVNRVPVPFFTVAKDQLRGYGLIKGCFSRAHLLVGNNYFSFSATVENGDHCTNMQDLLWIDLPNGERVTLFSVQHQGTAVHGETTINLSLSRIDPQLAAELNRYTEILKQHIEQVEALDRRLDDDLGKKDLDALENRIREVQKTESEVAEAADQAIEEINAMRHQLPNKQILLDGDQLMRRIYAQLKTLHSGHVDAMTLPELARLLHENRASFRATDLWNLSEFISGISRSLQQPRLTEQMRHISEELEKAKADLERKAGETKKPANGGVEAFQSLTRQTLATLKSVVAGSEVQDRKAFLTAYRLWLNKQLLAAQTLPRSDLPVFEQTNQEVREFVAQFYDEKTGWLLKCHISGDMKAAVEQLIQLDKLRGKKTQEALNFWLKKEDLSHQQRLIAKTLRSVTMGFQAVHGEDGAGFEEIEAMNRLLEQCIEAIKQTSYTMADIGTAFVPFVGDFKDLCEAVTGKRLCMPGAADMSQEDRVYAAVGMIAGTGSFWKAVSKSVRGVLASVSDVVSGRMFLYARKHWNKIVEQYKVSQTVADTLRKLKWGLPEEVFKKLKPLIDAGVVRQAELGAKAKRGKAGIKWLNEHKSNPGQKVSIRIDKADPASQFATQRVDHVMIIADGRILGSKGQVISGEDYATSMGKIEAHIPLSDWMKWGQWNRP